MDALTAAIERLTNIPSFPVWVVDPSTDEVTFWFQADGSVIGALVVGQYNRELLKATAAAQIAHWGVIAAEGQRAFENVERKFRTWKGAQILAVRRAPEGVSEDEEEVAAPAAEEKPKGKAKPKKPAWKQPSKEDAEMMYRQLPEYLAHSQKVERVKASFNSLESILEGWQAVKDLLTS
jgi:hypothetical protein